MVRTLFRTAFIGMMAVAGLFLLFFILKVVFFFLMVGFIARMAGRRFWYQRMGQLTMQQQGNPNYFGASMAESISGRPVHTPFGAFEPRSRQTAIIEITR